VSEPAFGFYGPASLFLFVLKVVLSLFFELGKTSTLFRIKGTRNRQMD
jgi:hypothetical protein